MDEPRRPAVPSVRAPKSVKPLITAGVGGPTSAAINDRTAQVGSYYIGNYHELIHRHTESIDLNPDQTAHWKLKIDFELPTARRAQCGSHNGEALFVFPLLFLRKAEGRTGFEARDEQGAEIPLPNRRTSDRGSALAAARSASQLLDEARRGGKRNLPVLPLESLEHVFLCISAWRAYEASVILNHLLNKLDPEIVKVWEAAGLTEDLEMLVDHSLVWVPLRGLPGERRAVEIGHDIELSRRPLLRWHFGELRAPRFPALRWRRARQREDPTQVLDTGERKYGRSAWRVSFSVLGERLAQPLAWMPIEFDFPTIYSRRCSSYHFEMNCPQGLSPRGVKVALDREGDDGAEVTGRTTIGSRAAHVYLPGGRSLGDITFRTTVGIGNGAFPILWLLMGVISTGMLWALVAFNPNWLVAGDPESHNEIAAGVFLIVPALLGAIIIGAEDSAVSSLIGGARIALLGAGLCCVAATAVLIGVPPFSEKPQATWAVCAAVATAATIPMATSWLLSLPGVWRGLKVLHNTFRQYVALFIQAALVALIVFLLKGNAGGDTVLRAGLASSLLLLTVTLTLLASNRLAVELDASRRFVSVGALILAAACLAGGCLELQSVFAPHAHWRIEVEAVWFWLALLAPLTGIVLWTITRIFGPREDELSIAPQMGRALLRGERIRELRRLRELSQQDDEEWFWGFPRPARDIFRNRESES